MVFVGLTGYFATFGEFGFESADDRRSVRLAPKQSFFVFHAFEFVQGAGSGDFRAGIRDVLLSITSI